MTPARSLPTKLLPLLLLGLCSAAAQAPAQSADTLAAPDPLPDLADHPDTVRVTLTAAPTALSMIAGAETGVYAYNGRVPGPTLDVHEGDHVIVRFRNDLPEATTVHWHGLHLPFDADGSPFHPVPPGEEYEYAFTVPEGTAGTYWYHPHPHHHTAWQVGMGLYGAVIVHPQDDPLPPGITDKLLILSDNRFAADGALDFPDPSSRQGRIDEMNGREGDVLFVNGQIGPTVRLRPGEVQRWRVINASGARIYRLSIPGLSFLQIGTDGGFLERAVEIEELVLANGERAELLVRAPAEPEGASALQTLPYDRYMPQTRPADWERTHDLLRLEYSDGAARTAPELPERLRSIPPLDPSAATATQRLRMSQGRINSRTMDMDRVDVVAPLGATEIWEVENLVGMDHPFHLHGFQFQVLERNGVPEPYRSWKDTVNVPKRESVRFIVRYDDFAGKWMFHCHILDHEDQGMMGVLEVR